MHRRTAFVDLLVFSHIIYHGGHVDHTLSFPGLTGLTRHHSSRCAGSAL